MRLTEFEAAVLCILAVIGAGFLLLSVVVLALDLQSQLHLF